VHLQLPDLLAANAAYRSSGGDPDAPRPAPPSRHLVLLTCMDARLDLPNALGIELGTTHVLRNGGGRVTDDVLRSLVLSTHVLGTREVGVIHHTRCGLEGADDDELQAQLGVPSMAFLGFDDVVASVGEDVDGVVACDALPAGVVVWGAVYDVERGSVEVVVEPRPAGGS